MSARLWAEHSRSAQGHGAEESRGPQFTLESDLAGANQVTLVAHEDDGSLRLRLPQEESQLGGAVETAPVGH